MHKFFKWLTLCLTEPISNTSKSTERNVLTPTSVFVVYVFTHGFFVVYDSVAGLQKFFLGLSWLWKIYSSNNAYLSYLMTMYF